LKPGALASALSSSSRELESENYAPLPEERTIHAEETEENEETAIREARTNDQGVRGAISRRRPSDASASGDHPSNSKKRRASRIFFHRYERPPAPNPGRDAHSGIMRGEKVPIYSDLKTQSMKRARARALAAEEKNRERLKNVDEMVLCYRRASQFALANSREREV